MWGGIAGYALLALSAFFTLEKELRWAVWVVMAGLALKTWVAAQKARAEDAAQASEHGGGNEVDRHEEEDGEGEEPRAR